MTWEKKTLSRSMEILKWSGTDKNAFLCRERLTNRERKRDSKQIDKESTKDTHG
jgi:hypothetical protein